MVYNVDNYDQYGIEFVHNPEGYIRYLGMEEHYHFYYIKDLLGNIRETYVNPSAGYKECIQRMQYYPSGLPWLKQQVHPSSLGSTIVKSLWRCMAWMSTTAKRVGIILLFAVQPPWIRWRRSIIQHRLMRGVGIIL